MESLLLLLIQYPNPSLRASVSNYPHPEGSNSLAPEHLVLYSKLASCQRLLRVALVAVTWKDVKGVVDGYDADGGALVAAVAADSDAAAAAVDDVAIMGDVETVERQRPQKAQLD